MNELIERMDQADRIKETDNQLKALADVLESTDCGTDLLTRLKAMDEAKKALGGRLGTEPDVVVYACQEYVAAEDALPDCFDTEDYRLSKAVESLANSDERIKALEGETRFLADSIDRRDDKIRVLDSKLRARDTALAAARVALCLAAGISAVRSDKKLDHQIKEAKEASVSAIEQIDAAGLPQKAKLTQTP